MKITYVCLLVFLISVCFNDSCYAVEYFISPTGSNSTGDGSYQNPWFSPIRARKSYVGVPRIAPGDVITFKNGHYIYTSDEHLILGYSADDSGTLEQPITYRAETRGGVTIDANQRRGWGLSSAAGSKYIIIDGFNIVNTSLGISLSDTGQIVRYCNVTATATWPPTGVAIERAISGGCFETHGNATGFLVEHCIADNCSHNEGTQEVPISSSHGLYFSGGSGTIRDNIFRNNIGNGIQIQSANASHIIGTVYAYRNRSYNNNGAGLYSAAYGGGSIDNLFVHNNLFWGNTIGITIGQYNNPYIINAVVSHNTVYGNITGITGRYGYGESTGILSNNISVGNTTDDYSYVTRVNTELVQQNNLAGFGSAGVGTLYESFSPDSFVSIDLEHEDFLKLKSSASSAIDHGVNSNVDEDFWQTKRPQGSGYDIGAHEYLDSLPQKPNSPRSLKIQ